jgi:hypothetical protein
MITTFYEKLKSKEGEIQTLRDYAKFLGDHNLKVEGEYPDLKAYSRKLIESPEYYDNPVAQRIRSGQSLSEVAKDVFSQKHYIMKFSKRKREEYNKLVDKLAAMVPVSDGLRAHFILDPINPEGFAALFYAAGAGIATLSSYLMPDTPASTGALVTFGSMGTILGVVIYSKGKIMKKEAIEGIDIASKYIDGLLGRSH